MLNSHYFLARDPIERQEFKRVHDKLTSAIDKGLLRSLPLISFVMLKPDAYLRGLIPPIMGWLAERHIYPFAYRLVKLSDADIDNLYMFVKPKYRHTWWAMKKACSLAPCLPALVIGTGQGYENLSLRIRDLVGPPTPSIGHESQIRYRFKATHRLLNLIHAADDPAAAAREAMIFFDIGAIAECLVTASCLPKSGRSKSGSVKLDFEALVPAKIVDLGFNTAKYNVKISILNAMRNECQTIRGIDKHVERLSTSLDEEREFLLRQFELRDENAALRKVGESQKTIVRVIRKEMSVLIRKSARNGYDRPETCHFLCSAVRTMEATDIWEILTCDTKFRTCDLGAMIAQLVRWGISLDKYDEVVLYTGWAVASDELRDTELWERHQCL